MPFHNFTHGFNVMHCCYLILKNIEWQKYCDAVDVLALLVAAIGHDLNHPGLANPYH